MSITDDETEKAYPTRYRNETHAKKQFYCDTDDLQETYLHGRNTPPTNAEIKTVTKRPCWNNYERDGVDSHTAKNEDDAWNHTGEIPRSHQEYTRQAKELLETTRKAVNE